MKDLLEKIIRENKDALEQDAPTGHFERFETKLNKSFKHRNKFGTKFYLQLAASLIFVLLLGNQLRIYFAPDRAKQQDEMATLSSVSDEYREVEFYFTSAINQGMTEWDKLIEDGFISQNQLQKELQANPDDERVINAMLDYYQARLSVTTLIIEKLKEVKHQKLTHNETEI